MGERLKAALDGIEDPRALTGADVLALRKAVYSDGDVDACEVRALLRLHKEGAGEADAPGWADFFVEALADRFALQREVPDHGVDYAPDHGRFFAGLAGVFSGGAKERAQTFAWSDVETPGLPDAEIEELILAFRAEGGDRLDPTERRVFVRLLERTAPVPETLKTFVQHAMYATVHADGVIDADEVELLRAVVFGPGGDGGQKVSRSEAELLFALKRDSDPRKNADEWRAMFASAVANHVLMRGDSPERIDAGEASWLTLKLGPVDAIDADGRAVLGALKREAQAVDPRIEAYFEAAAG